MRGPIWRFSLFVCVAAAFAQCASARQQLQDVAASPAHKEALAARKNAAGNHESRYRAPSARETAWRAPGLEKEAPAAREIPKPSTATHESQNRALAVHHSRKNERPALHERRALRDKLNSELVGIIFGGMDDADFSEAVDLVAVIGSPDVKILSVAGNGAKDTVTDLLFARGIDVGIVQTDVLGALKQKPPFPDVEKFLRYITKLYDEEIHILARNDIRSLNELRDERVNFGTYESGTYTSANAIFQTLGIPVQSTMYPQPLALEKLRRGEIAAMVYATGKPARLFQVVRPEEPLHFLSIPATDALRQFYKPTELNAHEYPDLIEKDQPIPTLSVGTVLVAYNWPPNSERHRKIAHFVQAFFRQMDELRFPPHHPKWQEVDIGRSVPGWTRFAAAEQWIAGEHAGDRENSGKSGSTQEPGAGAPPSAGSDEEPPISSLDKEQRDALFREFLDYQNNWNQSLFADFQAYVKAHSSARQ